MNRSIIALGILCLLLAAPQRLPAPISEVESPTPAPEQSPKPKPKRTVKPKVIQSSESSTKRTSAQATTGTTVSQPKLAGTWSGTLKISGILATTPNASFVINPTQNVVQWTNEHGTDNYPAVAIGNSISWKAGSFSEVNCSLTLLSDGQTAQVKMTSIWGSALGTVKKQN